MSASRSASASPSRSPRLSPAARSPRRRITSTSSPARLLAIVGNSLGTLAVVVIALLTIRRRPVGNSLLLAGVAVAAAGSALAGLGVAQTAFFLALAALLLYGGFLLSGKDSFRTRLIGQHRR
jgi:hypothetical protein